MYGLHFLLYLVTCWLSGASTSELCGFLSEQPHIPPISWFHPWFGTVRNTDLSRFHFLQEHSLKLKFTGSSLSVFNQMLFPRRTMERSLRFVRIRALFHCFLANTSHLECLLTHCNSWIMWPLFPLGIILNGVTCHSEQIT